VGWIVEKEHQVLSWALCASPLQEMKIRPAKPRAWRGLGKLYLPIYSVSLSLNSDLGISVFNRPL